MIILGNDRTERHNLYLFSETFYSTPTIEISDIISYTPNITIMIIKKRYGVYSTPNLIMAVTVNKDATKVIAKSLSDNLPSLPFLVVMSSLIWCGIYRFVCVI